MGQKNNFGVERIKIIRGEHSRWINKATFEKQKDKKGWYEEIPLPVMSKNEFVPPEVSNMRKQVESGASIPSNNTGAQLPDTKPNKPGRPSKETLNDPNK